MNCLLVFSHEIRLNLAFELASASSIGRDGLAV